MLRLQSSAARVAPAENQLRADLGREIELLAYDAPQITAKPGATLPLTLYWRARHPLDINYQVFVHLQDASGNVVAQSDKLNPGDFPTKRWPTDKYVRDEHVLELPTGLAPGEYQLSAGLWSAEGGWRLPVLADDGRQVGDHVVLPVSIIIE
jgi:hypothetical protein